MTSQLNLFHSKGCVWWHNCTLRGWQRFHSKPQWMIFYGQTVGGLTVYSVDVFTTWYPIAGWHSTSTFKTTVDDFERLDSRRVDCVLCQMHSPHGIILQPGIVNLSFKTSLDDILWSDSRRFEWVLCICIYHHAIIIADWHSESIINKNHSEWYCMVRQ